jgi:hypothetical protein
MYSRKGTEVFLCLQDRKCHQHYHHYYIVGTATFLLLIQCGAVILGCAITFARGDNALAELLADLAGANKLQ